MRLMDRMGSWLKAESHGVVDAIEDKGLLLKQAVREAEIALDTKRAEEQSLQTREKDLLTLLERSREEAHNLDADIELALEQEQEDLARFAARKLLPLRQRIAESERSLEQVKEKRAELEAVIASQANEFDALKARVREYLERVKSGESEISFDRVVSDEDVELELLRRKRKKGGA